MEWISVDEELPSTCTDDSSYSITVLLSDGENIGIGYHECEYFADNIDDPVQYSSAVWHDESNRLLTDISGWPKVIHWMPLPKPPREI